jgi:hypothetical protein
MLRECYIRFGDIPEHGYSKNHLTNEWEVGVSVYKAIEVNGRYSIILPIDTLKPEVCVSLSGCLGRSVFEVEGEVIGIGSDHEPIMENCKVVKMISKNKLEG